MSLACAVLACSMAASVDGQASTGPTTLWLKGNGLRLKTTIYQSPGTSLHPTLIVVLHGDLLGRGAVPPITYHYLFTKRAAGIIDDVVVAAILRPGYRDDTGEYSEGDAGLTTGDNYTPQVVDAIAQVIDQLKDKAQPAHTVIVGHSGGAAIAADLLGRWPSEVDGALLISCPCDLAAWRKHMMQKKNNNPIWAAPVESLSPIDLAGKVPPATPVRMLVGSKDDVAPPELTEHYTEALLRHSVDVTVTIVPGLEHDILLEPVAMDALNALVQTLLAPATSTPRKLRVSQGVMDGLLVRHVTPTYPEEAKRQDVQGDVILRVTIDKEGRVSDVKAISGQPILIEAAIVAVQQWRYKPYELKGRAVEVETTIRVQFRR